MGGPQYPDRLRRRAAAGAIIVAATLMLLGSSGCQSAPRPDAITFFSAASTISAVEEIADEFEQQSGYRVDVSFAASSTLATGILWGGSADLFLSASSEWAESVTQEQSGCQRVDLLGNRLVVVVPADSDQIPQSLADLVAPEYSKIAMGDPTGVPAGRYAREALESKSSPRIQLASEGDEPALDVGEDDDRDQPQTDEREPAQPAAG